LLLVQQRLGLAAPNSSRDGFGDGQTQQYLNLANTKSSSLWVSPTPYLDDSFNFSFNFLNFSLYFLYVFFSFQPSSNKNASITP